MDTAPALTPTLAPASDPERGVLPGLPPAHVLRAYLVGCVPLLVVYMIATETDGDLSRGFNLASALGSTFRFVGPAFVLLLPVWDITGWLERAGVRVGLLLLAHGALAIVFAIGVQWSSYGLIWLWSGPAAAQRALDAWFIWQAMMMMMMYWAAAGGFTAYRAVRRARAEAAATVQARELLARTELAALRNKLNPHFLFNTLHGIVTLVRKDTRRAEEALLRFSDLLRYVLDTEKSGADSVPLADELAFTRDYLALEQLRLGDRLQLRWQVDEAAEGVPVPVLTLQPLVENAIKHAFNPRTAPGLLVITARVDGGELQLEVRDDGPGAAPQPAAAGHGLGLATVARRLALLHGDRGRLQVDTAPGAGFTVRVSLPAGAAR
jgi:signal transduction histidine kinase